MAAADGVKAYDKLIDSPIADMKNVGGRAAGSITAAQFLRPLHQGRGEVGAPGHRGHRLGDERRAATWDKGATGYGVRLLDRFVTDVFEG